HPQADIMLLKYAPVASEIEEGVAFYGRAGSALMKSFKRLGIDPLAVYGTVFVKCPVGDTDLAAPECRARVMQEIAIVQPRMVVVANKTAELPDLLEALKAKGTDNEYVLVVPASGGVLEKAADPDAAREHTEPHLEAALERMRAEGLNVEGSIGDSDPVAAV